ncbi:hypothetical protein PF011_g16585 [Phytophthora fragariae]|uniref:Uncharacterized protein n=1 Tax=Phytophthora fragariae TaxID=53985 RepID=A0A6A3JI70_9STRA|nr:hypothetical protein PF011_g16585 [Phytophthora fragariae]
MTTVKAINDELITPDEDALMRNLFATVRTSTLKHRKQIYAIVYNFAAAACDGINPKTRALLLRRWEGLKRTQNRDKKRKRKCGDVTVLDASEDVIISPLLAEIEEKPSSSSQLLHATTANVAESSSCAASLSPAQSAAKPVNDLPGTHVGATSPTSNHTPNENISTHITTAMIPTILKKGVYTGHDTGTVGRSPTVKVGQKGLIWSRDKPTNTGQAPPSTVVPWAGKIDKLRETDRQGKSTLGGSDHKAETLVYEDLLTMRVNDLRRERYIATGVMIIFMAQEIAPQFFENKTINAALGWLVR